MQTYNLTAVVNWRGNEYYAFGVEFPMGGSGATVDDAIGAMCEEAKEYIAEGKQPNYVEPLVQTFDVTVHHRDGTVADYCFDAIVYKDDVAYCSFCPEVGTACCGGVFDHALAMIKEATELYLECATFPNYSKPEMVSFTLEY